MGDGEGEVSGAGHVAGGAFPTSPLLAWPTHAAVQLHSYLRPLSPGALEIIHCPFGQAGQGRNEMQLETSYFSHLRSRETPGNGGVATTGPANGK